MAKMRGLRGEAGRREWSIRRRGRGHRAAAANGIGRRDNVGDGDAGSSQLFDERWSRGIHAKSRVVVACSRFIAGKARQIGRSGSSLISQPCYGRGLPRRANCKRPAEAALACPRKTPKE